MKALINRELLNQTRFDSGALAGLSVVAHRFDQPALYAVTVQQKDAVVGRLQLKVSTLAAGTQGAEGTTDTAARPRQVEGTDEAAAKRIPPVQIDLQPIGAPEAPTHATELAKRIVTDVADGFVSFRAPDGQSDYAVIAEAPGRAPFDSRKLDKGDVFAVTLLRPGEYRIANAVTGATGVVTVSYPVIGAAPYQPPEPATIVCDAGGFRPNAVSLQPAQGVIFQLDGPGRITVELVKPDDGPAPQVEGTRPPRASWRRRTATQ